MKTKELVSLNLNNEGVYIAGCYDRKSGAFFDLSFLYYTKKEIFELLRREWGVIVPKKFENVGGN